MPPEPPALVPGYLVGGRYRLDRRIARGGMAEVWEALDVVLSRPVAVKGLLPHLAADEAFVTRFRNEAIAAARLAHPHIVSIYDTCADDSCEAIVMELVRGPTLREVLDDGPLPVARSVDVCAQVAAALDHAHRQGLVHRDVKPGNILLADDGRVLVTDFGIAKAAASGQDLTEVGEVMGTAKYLAPEQIEGTTVDARADLYALGVVLYEAVCGRPPFDGENATVTALARLTRDPLRPRQVRAGVSRDLDEVIMRALRRSPDDRYPSAAAMRAALLAIDTDGADATTAERRADRTRSLRSGGDASLDGPRPRPAPSARNDPARDVAPPDDDGFAGAAGPERSWFIPAGLIIVVAVTLGVVGVLLGRTEVGRDILDSVGGGGEVRELTVVEARTFDPVGGDGENDDEVAFVADGDLATAWRTEVYNNFPQFGRLKDGVGVILDLGGDRELTDVTVSSPDRNWLAEIYVGDGDGTELADWGRPVAEVGPVDADTVTAPLGEARGRAVLVWITHLGDRAGGSFQVALREVVVRGGD